MQYVSFAQPVSQGIVDCVEYLYIHMYSPVMFLIY